MNYIIFDTEFNQPTFFGRKKFIPNPVSPFEIIEIGAVKVDEQLNIVDTFKRFIKPKIYKILSPLVVRKTKITKQDLEKGVPFPKVFKEFKEWMGKDYILGTWGDSDIVEMRRNCQFHKIDDCCLENSIDIQKFYMYKHNLPIGQQVGLKTAMEEYNITVESRLHRALNDALYTAIVFQKIYDEKKLTEFIEKADEPKKKKEKSRASEINKHIFQYEKAKIICPVCEKPVEKELEHFSKRKYYSFGRCERCNALIAHTTKVFARDKKKCIYINKNLIVDNDVYEEKKKALLGT